MFVTFEMQPQSTKKHENGGFLQTSGMTASAARDVVLISLAMASGWLRYRVTLERGAREHELPAHIQSQQRDHAVGYWGLNRWFSSQMNSISSPSGMMSWRCLTVHGFV
jgi:hypothetical protein